MLQYSSGMNSVITRSLEKEKKIKKRKSPKNLSLKNMKN